MDKLDIFIIIVLLLLIALSFWGNCKIASEQSKLNDGIEKFCKEQGYIDYIDPDEDFYCYKDNSIDKIIIDRRCTGKLCCLIKFYNLNVC